MARPRTSAEAADRTVTKILAGLPTTRGDRLTNADAAHELALHAKRVGNVDAYDLALSAEWDFDFAMHADARGERSRAWAKRSSGRRLMKKAQALLQSAASGVETLTTGSALS